MSALILHTTEDVRSQIQLRAIQLEGVIWVPRGYAPLPGASLPSARSDT